MKKPRRVLAVCENNSFLGGSLVQDLLRYTDDHVYCLSHRQRISLDARLVWKKCDLMARDSLAKALADVDTFFLHSQSLISNYKNQNGATNDIIKYKAENIAYALEKNKVKQLILINDLFSRQLTFLENMFRNRKFATSIIHTDIIVDHHSPATFMAYQLIKKQYVLFCPSWLETQVAPLDIRDVKSVLVKTLEGHEHVNKTYSLAGNKTLSYLGFLKLFVKKTQKSRVFFRMPFELFYISRMWLRLMTDTQKQNIDLLINYLNRTVSVNTSSLKPAFKNNYTLSQALDRVLEKPHWLHSLPLNYKFKTETTVHLAAVPLGYDINELADLYLKWASDLLYPLFLTELQENKIVVSFFFKKLEVYRIEKKKITSNDEALIEIKNLLYNGKSRTIKLTLSHDRQSVFVCFKKHISSLPIFKFYYIRNFLYNRFAQRIIAHFQALPEKAETEKIHYFPIKKTS